MKKNNSLFINILVSFLFFCSLFFLFFIPLKSEKNTWNSYRILFLPQNADASTIIKEAKNEGINGIISKECIKSRFEDIDKALYADPNFTSKEDYMKWFENKEAELQYMYIPENQNISHKFFYFLKKNTDFFYIEDNRKFSLFQFIVSLLFFAVAFFYAQRKNIFFAAAMPFVIFASFQPGILALSASLLMMYTIAFWVEAVGFYLKFTKEQLLRRIKKNPLLIFLPVVSIVIANFNSRISLWLFILSIISSASFTYLSEKLKFFINKKLDERKIHKRIEAYAMNPNSIEKFWDTKKLLRVSVAAVLAIVFSSFFLFFRNTKTMQVSTNTLVLPLIEKSLEKSSFSKENYDAFKKINSSEDLPNLANLISDEWILMTMPYRNLHSEESGDSISFVDYSKDENNKIVKKNSVSFKLDDKFIKKTLSLRPSPSIEDLLYKQNKFIAVIYSSKRFPLNSFNFAAFIVALLTALLPIIIIFMRVRDK